MPQTLACFGSSLRGVRRVPGVPRTLAGAARNHVRGLRLLLSCGSLHRSRFVRLGAVSGSKAHVRPRSAGRVAIATAALR